MMNKVVPALVLLALIAVIGFGVRYAIKNKDQINREATDVIYSLEEQAVRKQITKFGSRLKSVSLLAPSAILKEEMRNQYDQFLSPELLLKWQNNPTEAMGRTTSSPWPDRIDITSVFKQSETLYIVEGNVIEITNISDPKESVSTYPVVFAVEKTNDDWLIAHADKSPYTEIAVILTVTGVSECLPSADTSGPQTMECALGIKEDKTGLHYGLDTSELSETPSSLPDGSRIEVKGIFEELDVLGNRWQKYAIEGAITATSLSKR